MPSRVTFLAFALPALLLAGCGGSDESYPKLMPLSELNRDPAIPAHASDAAADPEAVGAALKARRAQTEADAAAAQRPVLDAGALNQRARDLRGRADALANATLPDQPAAQPPAVTGAAPDADTGTAIDADTQARVRALRERAKALTENPVVPPADAALPPCPAGTADPAATRCNPT